jgi:small subunit ribosomal protein S21
MSSSHHNALVVIDGTTTLERALLTLKKTLLKAGVFKEIQKRAYHEKPSIKKRRKQTAARKRARKNEKKMILVLEEHRERVEARKQSGGRIYVVPKREVIL